MANLDGKKLKQVIDPTIAKAFTHPLRSHVWVTVCERGVVSPNEIALELEIDVSDVSYHFRRLHRRNLIGLHHTEPRRGTDEHFYEPVAPVFHFDDEEWMKLPRGIRASFSGEMVRQVINTLIDALESGSFDARSRHLSRTWLRVDKRGWTELMQAVQGALDRIRAIQERSVGRCRESGETPIPVEVILAGFETAASISRRDSGETESL